jgi:hypothetical protein
VLSDLPEDFGNDDDRVPIESAARTAILEGINNNGGNGYRVLRYTPDEFADAAARAAFNAATGLLQRWDNVAPWREERALLPPRQADFRRNERLEMLQRAEARGVTSAILQALLNQYRDRGYGDLGHGHTEMDTIMQQLRHDLRDRREILVQGDLDEHGMEMDLNAFYGQQGVIIVGELQNMARNVVPAPPPPPPPADRRLLGWLGFGGKTYKSKDRKPRTRKSKFKKRATRKQKMRRFTVRKYTY